eukprot:jgi/Tetstr1/454977/TSEL_041837.t1
MRIALSLALVGAASPWSLFTAGVLLMRFRAAQVEMYIDGGHGHDSLGPLLLLLAGSPCSDTLSVDAFVSSVRKAWGNSPTSELGGGLTGAVRAAGRNWVHRLRQDCRQGSRAYSAPLIFAALYIGAFYFSSGVVKVLYGRPFLLAWVNSGFLRSQIVTMWMRRWGEARFQPMGSFLRDPLKATMGTYLMPVARFDLLPGLIEAGGGLAALWECLHWYLMLCGPFVRALSMVVAVGFHVFVGWTMGISFYVLVAAQVALFVPWGILLDCLVLSRCVASPSNGQCRKPISKKMIIEPEVPGLLQRPLVWITIVLGLGLFLGQLSVLIKPLHRNGAAKRYYPFDHGPRFDNHGFSIPHHNAGFYTWSGNAAASISSQMVLHLEGGKDVLSQSLFLAR